MQTISVTKTKSPKVKPDYTKLGFGNYFTDHMFLMNYEDGKGWFDPRIVPYAPLEIDPASMVLHYAQEIFEGLKAYCGDDGKVRLFRPWDNFKRLNASADRMCIPQMDAEFAVEAVKQLVVADADWIPTAPDTSLYIRPFIFATDVHIGVHASHRYLFAIILSPVGAYYAEGLAPVKILIEDEDVRAVRGGIGFTKAGGNYAASLRAGERASKSGFSQVLWLDGVDRKYIEEVGAMNVFFKIKGEIVTPELSGSILPGITRDSCIQLLSSWGLKVTQRRITVDELISAAVSGDLEEAFGSGTAAVISPIGDISYKGTGYKIGGGDIGQTTQKLYNSLTGIQWGKAEDAFGWTTVIK
ncbi:MAG: branched-chain amino acid aminotransferase [Oscillospiraceae bacterium]|jgi:branched-chain amino acid aminotransferase|nr:branched-chain amino acid aminotransferase [Oscillospiraceae bacterium]